MTKGILPLRILLMVVPVGLYETIDTSRAYECFRLASGKLLGNWIRVEAGLLAGAKATARARFQTSGGPVETVRCYLVY
ncbi:hypothetical protein OM427_15715 [Halomonas sp. 18H]|uniref:hypothetical protein n=1 Tax=Halomonas almeriensis TaxID=308163 RepID=UPI002231DDF3|nr:MULTISPECIES: hypothetical protein [Halomonas]MCW4150980.1 hypothetical protein [Halomonas sp. 18H]MDN3552857.1 hypothetical protein [Halomonas almeriensis]